MSCIAIIPARGGSRRIPRKNFRPFMGKPILTYSVDAAFASGLFDMGISVSAEEADWGEIWVAAPRVGMVRRYPEYAKDEVGTQDVIRHALQVMQRERELERKAFGGCRPMPEIACCIYATAPTMTEADLRSGYREMIKRDDYGYIHGWFYWGFAEWFLKGRPLGEEMPRPIDRWIDINTEEDWTRAERMYQEWKATTIETKEEQA